MAGNPAAINRRLICIVVRVVLRIETNVIDKMPVLVRVLDRLADL